jgi:hypothetical protein
MTNRKVQSPLVGDIERQHPTVADPIGGGPGAEP